jgi:hypothetical protein
LVEVESRFGEIVATKGRRFEIIFFICNLTLIKDIKEWLLPSLIFKEDDEI